MGRPTAREGRARQDHAFALRNSGMTHQEVADSPDIIVAAKDTPGEPPKTLYASAGAARTAYLAAQRRHAGLDESATPPGADERRSLINDRWELLIRAWMPKAMEGDEAAAGIVARAQSAQARLYGANLRPATMPVPAGGDDDLDDVARKRAERMARTTGTAASAPGN